MPRRRRLLGHQRSTVVGVGTRLAEKENAFIQGRSRQQMPARQQLLRFRRQLRTRNPSVQHETLPALLFLQREGFATETDSSLPAQRFPLQMVGRRRRRRRRRLLFGGAHIDLAGEQIDEHLSVGVFARRLGFFLAGTAGTDVPGARLPIENQTMRFDAPFRRERTARRLACYHPRRKNNRIGFEIAFAVALQIEAEDAQTIAFDAGLGQQMVAIDPQRLLRFRGLPQHFAAGEIEGFDAAGGAGDIADAAVGVRETLR
jgi:hypothetical protein